MSAILRLSRVTADDAGEYECRLSDLGVGYLASKAWLAVLGGLYNKLYPKLELYYPVYYFL